MLQLRNQYGQIDLSVINPEAVAELSDAAQTCLSRLISAHEDRSAAQDRFNRAVSGQREAQTEQEAAHAAHREASDPFPFNAPNADHYPTRAAYGAAMSEARQQHDTRVRAYRENEARKAVIAAYNNSNH